jgi:recombinational DNA repair protein (RecF pathway)
MPLALNYQQANIHSLSSYKRNNVSYKTYTTEAFVCGSTSHNTSDKNYILFTREAGMLWATARSVREEKSKQRYALQDFSHVRVSLIKGKSGWRVGSAEALGNTFLSAQTRFERSLVHATFKQLRRYVHGEIPLVTIYNDVLTLLEKSKNEQSASRILKLFELRLLSTLGYIAPAQPWNVLVEAPTLGEALEIYDESMEAAIMKAMHDAAHASQL